MNAPQDIRHFMNIIEGELLPQPIHTLRIAIPNYQMMRTLLHLADPSKYTVANHYGDEKIMTFSDTLSFIDTKEKLAQFSVPYQVETEGTTGLWDSELGPETVHSLSPYPSNDHLQPHDGSESPPPKEAESTSDEKILSLSEIDPELWEPRKKRRPLRGKNDVKRRPRPK